MGHVISKKTIENKAMHILTLSGFLFLLCSCDQPKINKLVRGPSNEHSYQVWLQLAQWFQGRRLKHATPILTILGFFLLLCTSDQLTKLPTGSPNEHYYQDWLEMALFFQKRLKTDNYHFKTFRPLVSFAYL